MVGKPAEDIALANVGMSERTYRRNKSRGIATIFENPHAKSIQKFIQFLANSVTKENPKTCVRIGMYKIMHKYVEQKKEIPLSEDGPTFPCYR